jgi:pimeloyl-ACP methyl ester carboxylesterase
VIRLAFVAAVVLAAAPAAAQSRMGGIGSLLGESFADQGFWRITPGPIKVAAPKDGGTVTERQRFVSRLSQIDLEAARCSDLFPKGATQLVLAVHGIGGAGEEWEPAIAPLAASNTPLLMYRWLPTGSRDGIARALADGINRLQECLAGNTLRLVVVGHSAGGVLAATAASLIKLNADDIGPRIAIVTVAAPLGGMGMNKKATRGWLTFVEELGTDLRTYAPAAPGVRVLHVRTNPKSDMYAGNSSPVGQAPDWVPPGVPGARAIDLDETIEHSAAVAFAAKALQKDTWKLWSDAPAPAIPAPSTTEVPTPAPAPKVEEPVRPIPTAPPGQPVRM